MPAVCPRTPAPSPALVFYITEASINKNSYPSHRTDLHIFTVIYVRKLSWSKIKGTTLSPSQNNREKHGGGGGQVCMRVCWTLPFVTNCKLSYWFDVCIKVILRLFQVQQNLGGGWPWSPVTSQPWDEGGDPQVQQHHGTHRQTYARKKGKDHWERWDERREFSYCEYRIELPVSYSLPSSSWSFKM